MIYRYTSIYTYESQMKAKILESIWKQVESWYNFCPGNSIFRAGLEDTNEQLSNFSNS